LVVGQTDGQDVVEAPVAQKGRIQAVDAVRGANQQPLVALTEADDRLEQLVDDADLGAPGAVGCDLLDRR